MPEYILIDQTLLECLAAIAGKEAGIIWRNISWIAFQSYPGVTPKNFRQKKGLRFYSKPLIYLAPPDGLEPPT